MARCEEDFVGLPWLAYEGSHAEKEHSVAPLITYDCAEGARVLTRLLSGSHYLFNPCVNYIPADRGHYLVSGVESS